MVAVAMALMWGGYTIGIWGYCLVRGYDVTFPSLFNTTEWITAGGGPAATAQASSGGAKKGGSSGSTAGGVAKGAASAATGGAVSPLCRCC